MQEKTNPLIANNPLYERKKTPPPAEEQDTPGDLFGAQTATPNAEWAEADPNRRVAKIYAVHLNEPYRGRRDFYFTSKAAIYTVLTNEEIGIRLEALWTKKVSAGSPYIGKKCVITQEALYSCPQRNSAGG